MIGTINPVVYRVRKRMQWLLELSCYVVGSTASACALGAMLGWVGSGLRRFAPVSALTVLLLLVTAAYGLHELGVIRMPRPQRRWQVPAQWRVFYPPKATAFLYGCLLGLGFLTYVPVATLYVVFLWAVVGGNAFHSAVAMAVFGAAQAVPLLVAGWRVETADDAYRVGVRTLGYRGRVHAANGVALCAAAVMFLCIHILQAP